MNNNEFSLLLAGKIASTAKLLMEQFNWDEDYALKRFAESKLYSFIENQQSKVWYYSPLMLAQLFSDERAGQLAFPEV